MFIFVEVFFSCIAFVIILLPERNKAFPPQHTKKYQLYPFLSLSHCEIEEIAFSEAIKHFCTVREIIGEKLSNQSLHINQFILITEVNFEFDSTAIILISTGRVSFSYLDRQVFNALQLIGFGINKFTL